MQNRSSVYWAFLLYEAALSGFKRVQTVAELGGKASFMILFL